MHKYLDTPLEGRGAGEEQAGDVDTDDEPTSPSLSAEHPTPQRVTDGYIPFEGECSS